MTHICEFHSYFNHSQGNDSQTYTLKWALMRLP